MLGQEMDNPVLRSKDATASGGKANQSFSFTGHLLGANKLLMAEGETDKQFMALSGYACRDEKQCTSNYYLFVHLIDISVPPCVPSTGPRNKEARDVVVVPSTPFQVGGGNVWSQRCRRQLGHAFIHRDTGLGGNTSAGGEECVSSVTTLGRQCFLPSVRQEGSEPWKLDGLHAAQWDWGEAGGTRNRGKEGSTALQGGEKSRGGTSHWSPTWWQTVPTLRPEAIFLMSHSLSSSSEKHSLGTLITISWIELEDLKDWGVELPLWSSLSFNPLSSLDICKKNRSSPRKADGMTLRMPQSQG